MARHPPGHVFLWLMRFSLLCRARSQLVFAERLDASRFVNVRNQPRPRADMVTLPIEALEFVVWIF